MNQFYCVDCTTGYWGLNCAGLCNCLDQNTICNNTHGCASCQVYYIYIYHTSILYILVI